MGYCCIPSCKSSQSKGVSFHKFPTNIECKRLWINAISQQGNPRGCHWTPKGRSTICSKHFTDSDFSISTTKKILLPSSVPSVFEDLVGSKKVKRTKSVNSNNGTNRLNRVKKTAPKDITSDRESEPPEVRKTRKLLSVTTDKMKCYKNNKIPTHKIRKSKRCSTGLVTNDAPNIVTPTSAEETSNNVSAPAKTESATMLVEDTVSNYATSSLSEDLSDTDWEGIERSIEHSPQTFRSIQSVLQKLVSTIEKQRLEISKLKRERAWLTQELVNLT